MSLAWSLTCLSLMCSVFILLHCSQCGSSPYRLLDLGSWWGMWVPPRVPASPDLVIIWVGAKAARTTGPLLIPEGFSLMEEKTYHSCYKEASEPLSLTPPETPGHTWKARFGARGTCFNFWLLLLPTVALRANHFPYMSLGFLIVWWGQYGDNGPSLFWSLWGLEAMCIQHSVPSPTHGKKAATVTTARAG